MKHSEAVLHLRAMLRALQRHRSTTREVMGDAGGLLETLQPWIFGDKCPIPALVKILDRAEGGGEVEPVEFHNLVYIATRLEPSIGVVARIVGDKEFPMEAEGQWLRGWEPEGEGS